jgi:flavin reductase (DIM6/NTAB) family NADH-FMN oxidoreductase RutF
MACKGCPERSAPSTNLVVTGKWAMDHAARTGHDEFEEITTAPLRASLMDAPVAAGAPALTEVAR